MTKYQFDNKTKALEAVQKRWQNHHPFYHFTIDSGQVSFTYKEAKHVFESIDRAFAWIKKELK